MTVEAVYFDFGGVVARLDHQQMWRLEERYGLPRNGLWEALYGIPEWDNVKVGQGTERAWLEAVGRRLEEMAGRPIPGIKKEWVSVWRGLDQDVLALVKRLQGRYRVGLLSNATESLDDELANHHRIADLFDPVVNSARVGLAKPDRRIFELAARRMGTEPSACLHIDDLPQNVEGARAAGFQAVHYTGDYPSLEGGLRALGVSWEP